ncbi:MAG: FMN-binding negative transcriptional regulator [Gemmatimonadaceae bacterium]|nr:FMN-binding negative transcriptional regulator [Acetobacteraceae bacterium]
MYLRPVFTETDDARIQGLIEANPFGLLITHSPDGIEASHIPFLLTRTAGGFVLSGHLAAGNAQCSQLDGHAALAVFGGPHAYISPGWYAVQPAVPTWDYAAVHVAGTLTPVTDAAEVAQDLQGLAAGDPNGFSVAAMPPDYRGRMFAGIRAFTLTPRTVQAQWKMSQNRSQTDREQVVVGLRAQPDAGSRDTAALIEATLPGRGLR